MALIQVYPTSAQTEGITRKETLDRFLRETGLGMSGVVTTGGTTTFIDTTNLLSSQYPDSNWVGGWARISKDAGGASAAPENEQRSITGYNPATGMITVASAFTTVAAGDEYQLWRFPNPKIVKDYLDQVLINDIFLPCWSVLSEVPDFDMESTNLTDWQIDDATRSKVSTEPALFGKQWLRVYSTSTNGFARTDVINVEPGKKYILSAVCLPVASGTTGNLIAYNYTTSTVIDSRSYTRRYPGRIYFEFTAPSTCYQIWIKLTISETTAAVFWDDVILYPADAQDLALPNWVQNRNQVKGVFKLKLIPTGIADIYDTVLVGEPVSQYRIMDNAFGRGQLRLVSDRGAIQGPLFIFGLRNEVAFVDDTLDTKRIDDDLIFNALAFRVFDHLRKLPNTSVLDAGWITNQYNSYRTEYAKSVRQQSERLEEIITAPAEDGQFIDSRFLYGAI